MNRMLNTVAATAALAAGIGGAAATAGAASAAPPTYGVGWSAVIHHTSTTSTDHATLQMVGPTGTTVTLGEVSQNAGLDDVSPDGRHVITARSVGSGDNETTHFAFWDTATRRGSFLHLPGQWNAQYAAGGNILTWRTSDGLAYLRTPTGKAIRSLRVGADPWLAFSANGSTFVQANGTTMTVRSTADGHTLRTVKSPTGFTCLPGAQWDSSSFTAACETAEELGAVRTYRFGYTSAVPATALSGDGIDTVLATSPRVGRLGSGAGYSSLYQLSGSTSKPLAGLNTGEPTGGYGSSAFVLAPISGPSSRARLVKYDTRTHAITTLSGGSRGGFVSDAQTIDGH